MNCQRSSVVEQSFHKRPVGGSNPLVGTDQHIISGFVQKHKGRGKQLGYPTANISLTKQNIPNGAYLGVTTHKNKTYPSLIFIGAAVTFGEKHRQCEVYLLNYTDNNLYGEKLEVKTIHKIRENKSFPTVQDLIHQIQKDEAYARHYFQL